MHRSKSDSLVYYAKILIFFSLGLIFYGLYLNIDNEKRLFDPVKDAVKVVEEENTISITTVDGSEVVPGNKITNVKDKIKKEDESENSNEVPVEVPINTGDSSNNNVNTPVGNGNSNNSNINPNNNNNVVHVPTIDETNNNLRRNIESTYGISVRYGNETEGYSVGGFATAPVYNSTTINAALNRLNDVMSLYPAGFFYEIKNGGIPLTVILINNYSDNGITGVTDSSYTYANISIALAHPFEESFYHESYHYIERYIFKKGGNFNSWNSLNPGDFKYGTIVNNYSYANTFADSSPFVNNYAQTADAEDRASTFEYMMAESKASCLNQRMPVWYKANVMKNTIEAVFSTVKPNVVEYWERYI